MSPQEIVEDLKARGVNLLPHLNSVKYWSNQPLSAHDMANLKQFKNQIVGILYGANDIDLGDFILTPSGFGQAVEIYDFHRCLVSEPAESGAVYSYPIWEVNPLMQLHKIPLSVPLPLEREKWGDCLISGLEIVCAYREKLGSAAKASQVKRISDAASYLDCNWESLNHWQFKKRVSNYLNAHMDI